MKEFDEFTDAMQVQVSNVTLFSNVHSSLNRSTSDVARKGFALKQAVDSMVANAGKAADDVKGVVSLPTLPPASSPDLVAEKSPTPDSGGIPIPTAISQPDAPPSAVAPDPNIATASTSVNA